MDPEQTVGPAKVIKDRLSNIRKASSLMIQEAVTILKDIA